MNPEFVGDIDCADDVRPATLFAFQTLLIADRGLTVDELTDRTGLAKRTIRRACDELDTHGLVIYMTDPRYTTRKIVRPAEADTSEAWEEYYHDPEPVA